MKITIRACCPRTHSGRQLGVGGRPWCRGCGGARGPGAVAAVAAELTNGEEKTYGGCEGPDAMYVKLISSDGHEFIVKREHALTSGTIKAMLSGPGQFVENETNEVNFREIPSHVLSKVCMYFTYKVRYTNSSTEIPEFPIAPEIALELLMAANFLDC
uniref:Elongin-C n=1 Tax=Bos mutus grunniens TaxID=30521 RepID=A0A8C0AGV2_BOSMU